MERAIREIASLVFLRASIKASFEKFVPVFSSISVFILIRPLLGRFVQRYADIEAKFRPVLRRRLVIKKPLLPSRQERLPSEHARHCCPAFRRCPSNARGRESFDRRQPLVETFARLNFKARRVKRGIVAQRRDRKFGAGNFARVPDEPLLEPCRLCFRMKLQAERVAAPGESLIAANLRRCEQGRAGGQVEGIAVPVKHGGIVLAQVANRRLASLRTKNDWAPANFLAGSR